MDIDDDAEIEDEAAIMDQVVEDDRLVDLLQDADPQPATEPTEGVDSARGTESVTSEDLRDLIAFFDKENEKRHAARIARQAKESRATRDAADRIAKTIQRSRSGSANIPPVSTAEDAAERPAEGQASSSGGAAERPAAGPGSTASTDIVAAGSVTITPRAVRSDLIVSGSVTLTPCERDEAARRINAGSVALEPAGHEPGMWRISRGNKPFAVWVPYKPVGRRLKCHAKNGHAERMWLA